MAKIVKFYIDVNNIGEILEIQKTNETTIYDKEGNYYTLYKNEIFKCGPTLKSTNFNNIFVEYAPLNKTVEFKEIPKDKWKERCYAKTTNKIDWKETILTLVRSEKYKNRIIYEYYEDYIKGRLIINKIDDIIYDINLIDIMYKNFTKSLNCRQHLLSLYKEL